MPTLATAGLRGAAGREDVAGAPASAPLREQRLGTDRQGRPHSRAWTRWARGGWEVAGRSRGHGVESSGVSQDNIHVATTRGALRGDRGRRDSQQSESGLQLRAFSSPQDICLLSKPPRQLLRVEGGPGEGGSRQVGGPPTRWPAPAPPCRNRGPCRSGPGGGAWLSESRPGDFAAGRGPGARSAAPTPKGRSLALRSRGRAGSTSLGPDFVCPAAVLPIFTFSPGAAWAKEAAGVISKPNRMLGLKHKRKRG